MQSSTYEQASIASAYPHISPQALSLLSKMIEYDPAKRISAGEALEDPYFKRDVSRSVSLASLSDQRHVAQGKYYDVYSNAFAALTEGTIPFPIRKELKKKAE